MEGIDVSFVSLCADTQLYMLAWHRSCRWRETAVFCYMRRDMVIGLGCPLSHLASVDLW